MLTREQVLTAYELVLQRPPGDEAAIEFHRSYGSLRELGQHLTTSPEFLLMHAGLAQPAPRVHEHHVYMGYEPSELAVFREFEAYRGAGSPGFLTNFLGVKTRCDLQVALKPFDGGVEGLPEPVGSTQGETAEWIGTLKAVLEADTRFRLLELGAGYGPWMAITHAAASQRGITDIHVYGVEGDAHHIDFIRTNMSDNAIPDSQATAIHAAIGTEDGTAYWAVEDDAGAVYGGRPVASDGSDYLGGVRQTVVAVPVLGINGVLARETMWDLVHIDIQGHEGDVCRAGIEEMTRRVRRVVIGTHSRIQDGVVMEVFHKAGWSLENEKPTISVWNAVVPTVEGMALVDGVQVWRNPKI